MNSFRNRKIRSIWMTIGLVGAVFGAGVMSTSVSAATYTASISTSPIDMNATAAGTGANITTNNVTVISTCPSGYTLGINSSEEDTKLYMGGDSSNGTNNNTNYIDASNGTPANPVVITGSNLNTWGYSTTSSTTSGTFIGLTNNIATLATSVEPTSSTGTTIPVYYGVSVGTDRAAGTYQMANNGTIVYTLTTDLSCTSYQVVFNSNGGTGTMDNQWIAEDDSVPLSNNTFTPPSGYKFHGWNTSADGTGTAYANRASVTNLTTLGNTITLYAQWRRDPCDSNSTLLYCKVEAQVKKTNGEPKKQSTSDLQAVIGVPTSSNPATDTSNSGVYLYDEGIYGKASDVDDKYDIYYFRGILDSDLDDTTSTYGSAGNSAFYQNYVILSSANAKANFTTSDTCWRIVRTTASGGTKMIYNGTWTGTTCANATTAAQLVDAQAFGLQGNSAESTYWYRNINRVGYTFNNAQSLQDSTDATTPIGTVFGDNGNNKDVNSANSNIKTYIENWFASTNGISAYESILEPSAGYCNDRSAFSDTTGNTELSVIPPYATSRVSMYFGSHTRNFVNNSTHTLTLTCPRGVVDIYTFKTDNNTNLNDGNGQLSEPIALLTADETALAGSGSGGRTTATTRSSNYSYSSYLRSGNGLWLLSPSLRAPNGFALGFVLSPDGYLGGSSVKNAGGVRPAISLKSGTTAASGTGTATNPWVVTAP